MGGASPCHVRSPQVPGQTGGDGAVYFSPEDKGLPGGWTANVSVLQPGQSSQHVHAVGARATAGPARDDCSLRATCSWLLTRTHGVRTTTSRPGLN